MNKMGLDAHELVLNSIWIRGNIYIKLVSPCGFGSVVTLYSVVTVNSDRRYGGLTWKNLGTWFKPSLIELFKTKRIFQFK